MRQWPKISIFAPAGKSMRWIEKSLTPFRIVTTLSISMQSLGRSNYARRLQERKLVFFYRQDAAKRQSAGIVFTHRSKIRFLATQRRLVAPILVKLCSIDGHLGLLGCAKFHVNRCRRLGMRPPKYQKFPLFGKESPRRGDSLDRFPKFLGAFIPLTILR